MGNAEVRFFCKLLTFLDIFDVSLSMEDKSIAVLQCGTERMVPVLTGT